MSFKLGILFWEIVMQFKSPWSERSDLYADYSDEHFATHPASTDSYPERQIKVKQVLNIAKDPISGKDLPPEAIPNSAIRSRIGQDVNVESFAFKPTAGELLTQMNFFLDGFIEIIQRYQLDSNHYLTQIRSAFHFAFGSITPPGTYEEFFQQKRLDANEDVFKRLSLASNKEAAFNRLAGWKQLIHYSQEFMDTVHPTMKLKEIKINADGHVVLRMTIQEAEAFLRFRNDWQRLFSENYVRYSDPEKITTLACVLAVVDLSDLTEEARIGFMQDLNLLFSQVAQAIQNKVYHFDVMEFS